MNEDLILDRLANNIIDYTIQTRERVYNNVREEMVNYYWNVGKINAKLHKEVDTIKLEYKQKEFDIEWKYKSKIKSLEKENSKLYRIIDKFHETIEKFIHWICKKFDIGAEDNLVRDFQKETNTLF